METKIILGETTLDDIFINFVYINKLLKPCVHYQITLQKTYICDQGFQYVIQGQARLNFLSTVNTGNQGSFEKLGFLKFL